MDWIKLYTRKWIWGSGRTMTPEHRGVWVDLLALVSETKLRDGTLRHDVGQPMQRDWIAAVLMISRTTLDECLGIYQADINAEDGDPRIKIWADETIELVNWAKYQGKPENIKAKEIAQGRARETRDRHEAVLDAQMSAIQELQKAIRDLTGQGVKLPVICPFCGEGEIGDRVTLARHIQRKADDAHLPGKGWADEFLSVPCQQEGL